MHLLWVDSVLLRWHSIRYSVWILSVRTSMHMDHHSIMIFGLVPFTILDMQSLVDISFLIYYPRTHLWPQIFKLQVQSQYIPSASKVQKQKIAKEQSDFRFLPCKINYFFFETIRISKISYTAFNANQLILNRWKLGNLCNRKHHSRIISMPLTGALIYIQMSINHTNQSISKCQSITLILSDERL